MAAKRVTKDQIAEARRIGQERATNALAAGRVISDNGDFALAPFNIARRKALLTAFREGWASVATTANKEH